MTDCLPEPGSVAEIVGDVLRIEAETLLAAADRVDEGSFAKAVDLLIGCSGKVILTGAGTSGTIATKIAATLTSTGTPALFLHPGDALHGGLGLVERDDVAVMISNSGETSELLTILPYFAGRDVPYIAIVGNLESNLARGAAVALDASVEREACPLDLAPTSSTSLALATGDALAVAVMRAKGVTSERFARNHPSGRLGRRLLLRVRDLMHAGDELARVGPDASLLDVVSELSAKALGGVCVVDDAERLVGIVTDGDLRRAVQEMHGDELHALTAADLMTAAPVVAAPGQPAYEALQLMEERPSQISVLPVVEGDGGCVGLIRLHDLVGAGL